MKKNIIIVLALIILCAVSSAYAAEDLTGKVSVGVDVGGVFPKYKDVDNTWYVGGNLAYGINKYFAIGAEAGWSMLKHEVDGTKFGDIDVIPVFGDLILRYPMDMGGHTLMPYAIGGLGTLIFDYKEESLLKDAGVSAKADSELAVKLGGGFDYFVTKNVALNVEGSYVWSNSDISAEAFSSYAAVKADTDYWTIKGGLKYYFD